MDIEQVLAALRASLASDASPDARKAGAAACRAILASLDPATLQPPSSAPSAPNAHALASALVALRGVPPEQLLDLAITKLRAAVPAGVTVPASTPLKFQLVPIPRGG
ncbi:MAG TPA: hypothetical protein VHZ95_11115 [Polyangiales bacterium]|jgi:hypothetical protein|nr:hypothetical protein [Polyangiales bacterium]